MATVCLTFDVDAEAGLGAQLEASRNRLGTLTERAALPTAAVSAPWSASRAGSGGFTRTSAGGTTIG